MGLARFAVALGIDWQDAGTGGAGAAIEFQAEHAMYIQAETDGARGVARFELTEKTLSPFPVVMLAAIQLIAVEVVVARMHVEAGPFDKAFGLFLVGLGVEGDRCSQCNEQGAEA
ncbi:hypothetical protein D3C80_1244270 [compost metagenome]